MGVGMNRQIVPVFLAVSALVAASCGGSDGSESSPVDDTVGTDSTGPLEDGDDLTTPDPAPPSDEVAPPTEPEPDSGSGAGTLPDDTGPELEWIEVEVDERIPPGQLMWTGSSFIIGTHDDVGATFLRSTDGVDWQPLSSLPDGVDWFGIHAADESIVVWGTDPLAGEPNEDDGFEGPGPGLAPEDVRLAASTDGGATWVELDGFANLSGQFTSPYLHAVSSFYGAATSGDIVFVSLETFVELDFEQILTDNGADPARLADVRRSSDGIAICLFPIGFDPAGEVDEGDGDEESDEEGAEPDESDEAVPADEGFEGEEGDAEPSDEAFEGEPSCEGAEGVEVGIEQLDVTFEQLGLNESDITALEMGSRLFEIFRSLDGGPFEAGEVDPPFDDWHPGWLRVVDGEFVSAMMNESGETLIYRSADALEWEHGDPISGYIEGVTTDGVSMFAQSYSDEGPVFLRSDDGGRTWTEFGVPGVASDEIFSVSAGPAGVAVFGALFSEPSVVEPRPFLFEKDGYGVNISDDNFLTIVELATGETVFELAPDEDPADSEYLIMEETSATLLDPDTLKPLLTITDSDWEQAYEQAFDERQSEPEFFVGWSTDGETWGWQFSTDAFGANGGAQFAVGDGVVVAMYQPFDAADGGAVRIFTAQVG